MDTITAYKAKTKSGNYVYIPEITKVAENFLLGDKKLSTASNDLLELKEKLDKEISSLENVLIEGIVQDNLSTSFTILSNFNKLQKQLIDLSASITPEEIEDVYDSDAAKEYLNNLSSVLTSDPRISDFVPSELDLSEIEARYQLSVDEIFSHLNNNDLNLDLEFGSKKRNISKLKARSDADDRSSAKTSLDGHCKEDIESLKRAKNALKNTYEEKRKIMNGYYNEAKAYFNAGYAAGKSILKNIERLIKRIKEAESLYGELSSKAEEDKIHQSLPEGFDEKNECCAIFKDITNRAISISKQIESLNENWNYPCFAWGVWNGISNYGNSSDPIDYLTEEYNKYCSNMSYYCDSIIKNFNDLISYVNEKQNKCHKLLQNDSLPTDTVLSEVEEVERLLDDVLTYKESRESEAINDLNHLKDLFLNEIDDASNAGKSIASYDLESFAHAIASSIHDLANSHGDCHSDVCEIYFHLTPPNFDGEDLVEIRYGSSKENIKGGIPTGISNDEYRFKEWDWDGVDLSKTMADVYGKFDERLVFDLYKKDGPNPEEFWKTKYGDWVDSEDIGDYIEKLNDKYQNNEDFYDTMCPSGYVFYSATTISNKREKVLFVKNVIIIKHDLSELWHWASSENWKLYEIELKKYYYVGETPMPPEGWGIFDEDKKIAEREFTYTRGAEGPTLIVSQFQSDLYLEPITEDFMENHKNETITIKDSLLFMTKVYVESVTKYRES